MARCHRTPAERELLRAEQASYRNRYQPAPSDDIEPTRCVIVDTTGTYPDMHWTRPERH